MIQNVLNKWSLSPDVALQIALSYLAFILVGMNDGIVGVLIPSICAQYQVDKATVSLIFLCSTAGYLVAAFNTGWLIDKLGIRYFLLLGTGLIVFSTATLSFIPPFALFAPLLAPLGFGMAILDAGLNAYLARMPKNATLLNYLHAFYGIGALIGPIVASAFLAASLTWNSVYRVSCTAALLIAISIFFVFKEQGTRTHEHEEHEQGSLLMKVFALRFVWIVAGFLLLYVGAEVSIGSWTYSYLTQARGMETLFAGWIVSGYWTGLTFGRLFLGSLIQRIGEQRAISWCVIGAASGVLLVWIAPMNIVAAIGFCWTGFWLGPIFPTVIALMSRLISSRLLPSVVGFLASLGSGGAALLPWLAGHIIQTWGLTTLLPYAITLILMMIVLWIALHIYLQHHPIHRV